MGNAITVARCLNAFGFGLLQVASINLLYTMVRKEDKAKEQKEGDEKGKKPIAKDIHSRVQQICTNHQTSIAIVEFIAAPITGGLIDAYGRLPTMTLVPILSGLMRLRLAYAPSLSFYFMYRVITGVSMQLFMRSMMASLGDIYGRGTRASTLATSRVERYALLSLVSASYFARWIKNDRINVAICGCLQLVVGALMAVVGRETLHSSSVVAMTWRANNPLSFVAFFLRSPPLLALFFLRTLRELPMYCNIHEVFRRQRFTGWGREQQSNHMILGQVAMLVGTATRPRLMDWVGLRECHRE
jgi:MFS family permease